MKKRLLTCLLLLTLSGPALARSVEDRLIAGLKTQGYVVLENGFTWLGRLRIVAQNAKYHREIVVNPETGEILRDYVVLLSDIPTKPVPAPEGASAGDSDESTAASVTTTTDTTDAPHTGASIVAGVTDTTKAGADELLLAEPVIPLDSVAP